MRDYSFGDYIYELRNKRKISQSELGKYLGVSNKAVSKWENGVSKPSMNILIQLAKMFDVKLEDMFKLLNKDAPKKKVTKIVITGGPCAGKSTAMSWISDEFTQKGYRVLFVPETATELITAGVAPWTCEEVIDFQKSVLKLQIEKEKVFENVAQRLTNTDKVLIVCDRGAMDSKAYIDQFGFEKMLDSMGLKETQLRDDYDAVFHLVTAAKGAGQYYSLSNNTARTETPEVAIDKDNQLISAWTGHPYLRVIDNSTDFESKMKKLVNEISGFLGEPQHYEIERKYLISYPNITELENNENCKKVEIIQTYLKSDDNNEIRVRQRGTDDYYTYTKTTKQSIDGLRRLETETRISKDEYLRLLMDADTTRHQIRKTRYCLVHNNQYFEIDIYPFWKDKAILEIELNNENQSIDFPPFIKVIKEVTDIEQYKNFNLAKLF